MIADLVNSGFEFFGAAVLLLNVRQALKDKVVAGVSIVPVAYFSLWGFWNLYYYPVLGQWWSTAAAALVAIINSVWLVLLVRYGRGTR